MSTHTIYIENGVKMMRPVTNRQEYLSLRDSSRQRDLLARIRNGDEHLKHQLVQMNYSCQPNPDGTLRGSKHMSNTVGMDIDHVPPEQMPQLREHILGLKEQLGLKMLEESARGQGYHLVFARKPELSQEENLQWAADLLSVAFDAQAKDITRVFFTTTAQQLIYLDDGIFDRTELNQTTPNPSSLFEEGNRFPSEFNGIGYSAIIAEFWRRSGGEPPIGKRNMRLHQLAANLRAICDNSEATEG